MNPHDEIYNELHNNYDEEEFVPKARYPKKLEPINKYEYCEEFARILERPIGYVLGRTKGIPENWLYETWSYLKTIRDHKAKIKYLMWWLKTIKPKNTR